MYRDENYIELEDTNIEDVFNINKLLTTLFLSIQNILDENNIELIFDMDSTLPRNLHGDSEVLLQTLTKVLTFVVQNCKSKELVLSLSAPKDFLYEEFISFNIQNTNIDKNTIKDFLKSNSIIKKNIKLLNGKIFLKNSSDIDFSIPFKNIELGFRRHYRLPEKTMVGKKILLFCVNIKTAESIKKMFEYFLYDVSIADNNLKISKSLFTQYDILIINEKILTKEFKKVISTAQEQTLLKDILLTEPTHSEDAENDIPNFRNLTKPVTQEKVLDLIVEIL